MPPSLRKKIQVLCSRLILDPRYLVNLRARLRAGKLPPQMEAVVWYYAFGKPTEHVKLEEKREVRILHTFISPEPTPDAKALASASR